MKKFNKLYRNILKQVKGSRVYYIPGWNKSITEYSAQFISGKDPKVKEVKNDQLVEPKKK